MNRELSFVLCDDLEGWMQSGGRLRRKRINQLWLVSFVIQQKPGFQGGEIGRGARETPVVPRKSGLHGRGVGERLIALESW